MPTPGITRLTARTVSQTNRSNEIQTMPHLRQTRAQWTWPRPPSTSRTNVECPLRWKTSHVTLCGGYTCQNLAVPPNPRPSTAQTRDVTVTPNVNVACDACSALPVYGPMTVDGVSFASTRESLEDQISRNRPACE